MPNSQPAIEPANTHTLRATGAYEINRWLLSLDNENLPDQRPAIVPVELWLDSVRCDELAPCLAADTELSDELVSELHNAPFIAIHFPVFTDGRGYSLARLLRERYAIRTEIRAVGDVLIDQLFYMRRCGFDAFMLREDQLIEPAIKALSSFTLSYQSGVDVREPLFARRIRENKARHSERAELVD